jgi:serine/threonine-protein kinase HipA
MLSMRLAQLAGIETCECELVPLELLDHEAQLAVAAGAHFLAVKRFDRGADGRVHVEDLAQVFSVDPREKYRHITYVDIMRLMLSLPSLGQAAVEELLRRLLVNELLGNYDAHLKNLGFRYHDGTTPTLSPAYDVVAYAAYLPGRGHALPILRTQDKQQLLSPRVLRTLCNELGLLEAPLRAVLRRCLAAAMTHWEPEIAASALLDQQKRNLLNHFRKHSLVSAKENSLS